MKRKPRLGFLGVGWIGRNRLEAMHASGLAEIAAIADVDAGARDQARTLAPAAASCASLDELLELDLDGVVIATPSAAHAGECVRALAAGLAVFCQKPLARTADETSSVLAAARSSDRLLAVDFSYRHTLGLSALKELLQKRALGHVFAADLVFHNAYGPDKPWFYERETSGGGALIDLGVHLIDAALWALDFPEVDHVTSRLYRGGELLAPEDDRVEDYAVGRVDLKSGETLQIACSWNLSAGQDAVISASFYGTQAAFAFSNVSGSFYDFEAHLMQKTERQKLVSPPDAWGGRAVVEFARRLAEDARFDPEAEHLLEVAEIIDAMYGRQEIQASTTAPRAPGRPARELAAGPS